MLCWQCCRCAWQGQLHTKRYHCCKQHDITHTWCHVTTYTTGGLNHSPNGTPHQVHHTDWPGCVPAYSVGRAGLLHSGSCRHMNGVLQLDLCQEPGRHTLATPATLELAHDICQGQSRGNGDKVRAKCACTHLAAVDYRLGLAANKATLQQQNKHVPAIAGCTPLRSAGRCSPTGHHLCDTQYACPHAHAADSKPQTPDLT